jgi:hypothetical protein
MKKLILLSLISTNFLFAQNKKIVPGTYQATAKGETIFLRLKTDSTYELSVGSGKYDVKKDTLIFLSNGAFKIKPLAVEGLQEVDKIKLHFQNNEILYNATEIFLGKQADQNAKIEYVKIVDDSTFVKDVENGKEGIVVIDRTKFLYLVHSQYSTTVSKFEIPDNITDLIVSFSPYMNSGGETKLKGFIDAKNQELMLINGNFPLSFSEVKDKKISTNYIEPLSIVENEKWKKENGFEVESKVIDATAVSETAEGDINFQFKYKIENDFKNALNETKKTPHKILAINFDFKNKNRKTDFDNYIKDAEKYVSERMYSKYDAKEDDYNYYLASEKEKSLLKKYNINEETGTLLLNGNGTMLGFMNRVLTTEKEIYLFYSNLKRAKQLATFDSVLADKTANADAIKNAFVSTNDFEKQYNTNQELYEIESRNNKGDSIKMNNLYALKTNDLTLQQKWSDLIDFYSKKTEVDSTFIQLSKAELENEGFTENLFFTDTLKVATATDYKIMDYYFKNKKSINPDTDFYQAIGRYLNKVLYAEVNSKPETIEKLLDYYKKYSQAESKNFDFAQEYFRIMKDKSKNPKDITAFFDYYDSIYSDLFKPNTNIYENLNKLYESENESAYWTDFKNNIANNLNNIAWAVVEYDGDKTSFMRNAQKWSETSLVIEPNNHYYLDTLANLYFLNGEKDRAIATEKQAIEIVKKESPELDSIAKNEETLEKFKK